MAPTILVLFLFISYGQAISSASDFHTFPTSENRASNQSNVQQTREEFLLVTERFMYGSMKEEEKYKGSEKELSETVRKGGGGGGRGGTLSGFKQRTYPPHRSATSLLKVPLNLYVASLAFIFVFLFFS